MWQEKCLVQKKSIWADIRGGVGWDCGSSDEIYNFEGLHIIACSTAASDDWCKFESLLITWTCMCSCLCVCHLVSHDGTHWSGTATSDDRCNVNILPPSAPRLALCSRSQVLSLSQESRLSYMACLQLISLENCKSKNNHNNAPKQWEIIILLILVHSDH